MISNLDDFKKYLRQVNKPVIGVGVTAFNRLGLDNLWPDFSLIAYTKSSEDQYIKKEVGLKYVSRYAQTKPVNTLSILEDPKIQKILNRKKQVNILIYKPSEAIENIAIANNWRLLANPYNLAGNTLENKVRFRNILTKSDIKPIPGETKVMSGLGFNELQKKYQKFVLQIPDKGGGRGTAFISSPEDFDKFIKNPEHQEYQNKKIVITKFITAASPSITVCLTSQGIFYTRPQLQIIDAKVCHNPEKGSGLFCGTDFTKAKDIPINILKQIYSLAEKMGHALQKMNYKGILGLDLLWDMNNAKVYIVECNPRLLGVYPTATMAQKLNGEVPLLALHALEFLGAVPKIDSIKILNKLKEPKLGAQIILSSQILKPARLNNPPKAGIYVLQNNQLKFLRPGFDLKHLKTKEEFLLADGLPQKPQNLRPGQRLLRILTLDSVLDSDFKNLKPKYTNLAEITYNSLDIQPL